MTSGKKYFLGAGGEGLIPPGGTQPIFGYRCAAEGLRP